MLIILLEYVSYKQGIQLTYKHTVLTIYITYMYESKKYRDTTQLNKRNNQNSKDKRQE